MYFIFLLFLQNMVFSYVLIWIFFTIAIILFGTIMMVQIMTFVAKHDDEICFQNSYDSKSILIPTWLWLPYMYCVTDSPHSITIERHTFLKNAIKLKRKISFPHCDKVFQYLNCVLSLSFKLSKVAYMGGT